MSNQPIFEIANNKSTVDIGFTNTYNNLLKAGHESYHKSFDFSNVGISANETTSNKHLRQFHQTRLYIQDFDGMLHHGSKNGSAETTYLISANLPESFAYKIGSKWEAPLSAFGDAKFNALMQTVGNAVGKSMDINLPSGINRATTMKIWGGTEPLSLSLEIPVIDDGYTYKSDATGVNTNLVEALEFLGSLCLPKLESFTGFYTPPPSPLEISIRYGKRTEQAINLSPKHGRIILQLGGILLVDKCIIESVDVKYPNTKALIRHTYASGITPGQTGSTYLTPLLAMVTLNITTVEALTADNYSHMLWLKHQNNVGTGSADTSDYTGGIANFFSDTVSPMIQSGINTASNLLTGNESENSTKLEI